jgi:aspartyl-tRNA(Asn)/glutamyl-tRNA(Gln) amidotransferase subunit B
LHLSDYDAHAISDDKNLSDYFELLIKELTNYKAAANWLLGPLKSYMNENQIDINNLNLSPGVLAQLIQLVDEEKLNFSVASSRILPILIKRKSADALLVATEMNLLQNSNSGEVLFWVEKVLVNMPDKVAEYKKGKKGLIGLFVGEVKKISKGKADMKLTNKLLLEKLDKS